MPHELIQKTQAELDESQQRLELALDAGRMGIWEWNISSGKVTWSPGLEEIHGLEPGSFPGTFEAYQEDIHPSDKQRVLDSIRQTLENGHELHFEYRLLWPDGSIHWVEARGKVFRDESGQPARMIGVCMDITPRKLAEEQVSHSERRFRDLADSLPQKVWTCTPDGEIDYYNRQWREFTGLAPGTLGNAASFDFVHLSERDECRRRWLESIESGEPFEMAVRLRDKAGCYHWHLARCVPIRDADGTILHWYGTSTDIEAQKRASDISMFLAEASEALASLSDLEGTLERVARLAVPYFADWCAVDLLEPSGHLKRVAVAHIDPEKVAFAHEVHRRWKPEQHPHLGAYRVARQAASVLVSEITDDMLESSISDPELLASLRELGLRSYMAVPLAVRGKVLGVITFIDAESGRRYQAHDLALAEDLANRAAIAIENARLYHELREADHRKDVFLATLAHELRNPLAPIRNAAQMLQLKGPPDADLQWGRDVILRQVDHLTRLVDDLLDVSRITRNKLELRKEMLEISQVVRNAVESCRPLIDKAGHELMVTFPGKPIHVEGDMIRLTQVVLNLLTNAAKYTEPGGAIELKVSSSGSTVEIRVRDNGIGIDPAQLPKIFDMFSQIAPVIDRSQGGLGIGLALVRGLVEMHGGQVFAQSEGIGQGSEFVVHLPMVPTVARLEEPAPQVVSAVQQGKRILIADDNRDAADSLAKMLETLGHTVTAVYDGQAAVESAEALRPDVIILDIGMPRLNGRQAAIEIRRREWGRQVQLIALTGWGQDEDRQQTIAAGFNHHLVKPVKLMELNATLGHGGPV